MLAPLLIALLTACVLVMVAGWLRDQIGRPAAGGASLPSLPRSVHRVGRPLRVAPSDRGARAERSTSWAS